MASVTVSGMKAWSELMYSPMINQVKMLALNRNGVIPSELEGSMAVEIPKFNTYITAFNGLLICIQNLSDGP